MTDQLATAGAPRASRLDPGLYLVATPIGAARDITLRALDILTSADVIAAEDTRTARKLMEIHGVAVAGRPLIAYHDHSGPGARDKLVAQVAAGKSVAYVSEAGTPLVADPGYQLARGMIEGALPVIAAPGASAVLAALAVSGLPSDRFLFAGFPPQAKGAMTGWLKELAPVGATIILYESPRRVHRLLDVLSDTFGADRPVALCRELTKRFEEVLRGTVDEVRTAIADRALKGEIVVVIGKGAPVQVTAETMKDALRTARATLSVKDAAAQVAADLGLKKRDVYQAALKLETDE